MSAVTDIGSHVKVVNANLPLANAGSAVNGVGIDTQGYRSLVMHLATGAATGAPSAQTADSKLQDSADNSTFADVSPAIATVQIAADAGEAEVDVTLSDVAVTIRRYVRQVVTVVLTAGTSPTWPVSGTITLGEKDVLPN